MIDAKIHKKPLEIPGENIKDYSKYSAGGGTEGHWFLGMLFPGKLQYYGFEAWGAPYCLWEIDDYYADVYGGNAYNGTKNFGDNPFGESDRPENGDIIGGGSWWDVW